MAKSLLDETWDKLQSSLNDKYARTHDPGWHASDLRENLERFIEAKVKAVLKDMLEEKERAMHT